GARRRMARQGNASARLSPARPGPAVQRTGLGVVASLTAVPTLLPRLLLGSATPNGCRDHLRPGCVSSRTFSWVRVRRRRALGLPPRARRLRVTRQAARCAALHRALGVLAVDARLAFLLGLDRKARRLALL